MLEETTEESEKDTMEGTGREEAEKKEAQNEKFPSLKVILSGLILGFIVGYILSHFVVARAKVVGVSMEPTLMDGDKVFVCLLDDPERGDKVVTTMLQEEGIVNNKRIIKRVIGVPNDTIQIIDSTVYINGEKYEEDYLPSGLEYDGGLAEQPLTLGEDEYFLMGDNREESYDCRYLGPVSEDEIMGVVID